MVDCFLNPEADPAMMARFNRRLYVAVMPRTQVMAVPGEAVFDFYAINEFDVNGPHVLRITAQDAAKRRVFEKDVSVVLTGGETYGQLFPDNVVLPLPVAAVGMARVSASLRRADGTEVATGYGDLLAVN